MKDHFGSNEAITSIRPTMLRLNSGRSSAGIQCSVWMRAPTYSTGVGQTFTARLDDGTRVQLNTDSAVRVRFDKGQRKVVLMRGQAFFDVAHDAAHPFVE